MLSLDWLERRSLSLHELALPCDADSVPVEPAPLLPVSEIDRVHITTAIPENAIALDAHLGWWTSERTLYFAAEHELSALEALEQLALLQSELSLPVDIDPLLRPSSLAAQGEVVAQSWLASESEPLLVMFAARSLSFACLSPYPEDLGATLFAIARQAGVQPPHEGWAEALAGRPTRDLAALLAEHVLHRRSDLRAERRVAEHAAGLELNERALLSYGIFVAGSGAPVDAVIAPHIPTGLRLQLAASKSPLILQSILRVLLDAGRLAGLGVVFEDRAAKDAVFTSALFLPTDDAISHGGFELVMRAASLINHAVDSHASWIGNTGDWGVPIRLLRLIRRGALLDPSRAPMPVAFVGHPAWDLRRDDPREASLPLSAFRLAFVAMMQGVYSVNSGLIRGYRPDKPRK